MPFEPWSTHDIRINTPSLVSFHKYQNSCLKQSRYTCSSKKWVVEPPEKKTNLDALVTNLITPIPTPVPTTETTTTTAAAADPGTGAEPIAKVEENGYLAMAPRQRTDSVLEDMPGNTGSLEQQVRWQQNK